MVRGLALVMSLKNNFISPNAQKAEKREEIQLIWDAKKRPQIN